MSGEANNDIIPWLLTGVVTVIGALSTALVYVFRKTEYDNAQAIKELKESNLELKAGNRATNDKADKCEEDRHALFTQCAVMKGVLESNAAKILALETKISNMDRLGTKFENNFNKERSE